MKSWGGLRASGDGNHVHLLALRVYVFGFRVLGFSLEAAQESAIICLPCKQPDWQAWFPNQASRACIGMQLQQRPHEFIKSLAADPSSLRRLRPAIETLLESRVNLKDQSFTVAISSCGRSSLWPDALCIFNMFCACASFARLAPNLITYNAAISSLEKSLRWPLAVHTFALLTALASPDIVSYNSVISFCEKCCQWEMALDLFSSITLNLRPNVISYTSTMSSCIKGFQWQVGLALFCQMKTFVVLPDVVSYGVAISSCPSFQWQLAYSFFNAMRADATTPNLVSYNAAVSSLERSSQWHLAVHLFHMPFITIAPDVATFTTAMSAFGNGLQWKSAIYLSNNARFLGSNAIFNTAISCCEKSLQWQRAIKLFSHPSLKRDVISYNAVISSCEKGLKWRLATEIFNEIRCDGILPHLITYSAAISSCEKGAQWELAFHFLTHLERVSPDTSNSSGCSSLIIFNAVISSCEKASQWQLGFEVFRRLSERQLPDVISYNAVISCCEKGLQWKSALDFLTIMSWQVPPSVITYNAAISSCEKCHEWEWALHLFNDMSKQRIRRNIITYNAAISSCEQRLQWQLAMYFFNLIESPDLISYNAAISSCEKSSQWRFALYLFDSMKQNRQNLVEASAITYNAVIGSCEKGLKWLVGLLLFESMETLEQRPDALTFSSVLSCCVLGQQCKLAMPLLHRTRQYLLGLDLIKSVQTDARKPNHPGFWSNAAWNVNSVNISFSTTAIVKMTPSVSQWDCRVLVWATLLLRSWRWSSTVTERSVPRSQRRTGESMQQGFQKVVRPLRNHAVQHSLTFDNSTSCRELGLLNRHNQLAFGSKTCHLVWNALHGLYAHATKNRTYWLAWRTLSWQLFEGNSWPWGTWISTSTHTAVTCNSVCWAT